MKKLLPVRTTSVNTRVPFRGAVRLKSPIILLRMRSIRLWPAIRTGCSLTPRRARIPVSLSILLRERQRRTESILTLTSCVFCHCSRIWGRVHQTRRLTNFFHGTKERVNRCCSKTTPYDCTPALTTRLGCFAADRRLLSAYIEWKKKQAVSAQIWLQTLSR